VQLSKLRLTGFKSFADSQAVDIEPGLTGIVGPNGCGKSNIVEGIRWVMGEGSAKQLRGEDMDDVIFSGTNNQHAKRPARNLAEVVLTMDNQDRKAPAQYNDTDTIEISRAIERGMGSSYRINNTPARAKDVQLLFADALTGTNSTAIVSQGRIGQIVSAKPKDRRHLLEEAAGIVGLHSRRHEAELKLRGTLKNLERLDDVIQTMDTQLKSLKKQARHAKGYKRLNEKIKKLTHVTLYLKYLDAIQEKGKLAERHKEIESQLKDLLISISRLTKQDLELSDGIPPLREKEVALSAELQRTRLALRDVENAEQRLNDQRTQAEATIEQTTQDLSREESLGQEYQDQLVTIRQKLEELKEEKAAGEEIEAKSTELQNVQETVDAAEKTVAELTSQLATQRAQYEAVESQLESLENRKESLEGERTRLTEDLSHMAQNTREDKRLTEISDELPTLEKAAEKSTKSLEKAEAKTTELRELSAQSRSEVQRLQATLTQLESEQDALATLIQQSETDSDKALLNQITVDAGFEAALGAAFRDELAISDQTDEAIHWHSLPAYSKAPVLPEGVIALSDKVEAPAILARRMAHMGYVETETAGNNVWQDLTPGQVVVSAKGDVWRWDGLRITPKAASQATQSLKNKNRLKELSKTIGATAKKAETAELAHNKQEQALRESVIKERTLRETQKDQYQRLDQLRAEQTDLQQYIAETQKERGETQSRLGQITDTLKQLTIEITEKKSVLAKRPDFSHVEANIENARTVLHEKRSELYEKRNELDNITQRVAQQAAELSAATTEEQRLAERTQETESRLNSLKARKAQAEMSLQSVNDMPDDLEDKRQDLLTRVKDMEDKRREAASELEQAEESLRTCNAKLREDEHTASALKEERAGITAGQEHINKDLHEVISSIREEAGCEPGKMLLETDLEETDLDRDPRDTEEELIKVKGQREHYGAVNLMAEAEAEEVEAKITELQTEREDLDKATQKLRRAIGDLNRQGRENLEKAFEEVNQNFETLFRRLFGGGKATLNLVDSEDPLEAGIEIMASPPGKRLQSLTLLSGGEKALTAAALLFAVFLTKPAPICILDEVDAPLDDTNVDRFCTLLEEISSKTSTRFLIVTHHRMTMARMHRLYGVTMAEAGVSQLVSVNLEQAEQFQDAANG